MRLSDHRSLARFRGPVVLVAQRLGLASARASALETHLAATRDRLLNPAPGTPSEVMLKLEDRCIDLERELHSERLGLWRDVMPLMEQARDAAIERQRLAWLSELLTIIEGASSQPRGGERR